MAGRRRAKRAKGEGTFRKTSNGKWQWILRDAEDVVVTSGTGETKEAAKLAGLAKQRSPSSTTSTSLTEAWKALEAELESTLSPSNFSSYRQTLAKVEAHAIGDRPYQSIGAADIEELAKDQAFGRSVVTRRNHAGRVRAVLHRLGVQLGKVHLPKVPKNRRKATVMGREATEFLDWVRALPDNRRLAIGLIYMTGLRRSEACGLKYEHLTGKGANLELFVTETEDGVHVRPRPKTDESAAYVAIPAELRKWIGKGKGFVLGGKDPMRPRGLTQLIRRTVRKTKWARLRPQALRRAFGQVVWETTRDPKLTANNMRHSLAMTDEEYVQTDEWIKDRAVAKVFDNRAKTRAKKPS